MIIQIPMLFMIAGPHGSGKSTLLKLINPPGSATNADDIRHINQCSDLEAVQIADRQRNRDIAQRNDLTIVTVLSTDRGIDLIKRARENGYFVRSIFILTADPSINVARVNARAKSGGCDVPPDKIRFKYARSLKMLPKLLAQSDVCTVYDNTDTPYCIFNKKNNCYFAWQNENYSLKRILNLTGINKNQLTLIDGIAAD